MKGKVVIDNKTKELVKRIQEKEIALINHKDIDQVAGRSLVEQGVKGVININKSISGKYPNRGPSILVKAGIFIIDNCNPELFSLLSDGDIIEIEEGIIIKEGQVIGKGVKLTLEKIEALLNKARSNLQNELNKFIDNTLTYAQKEKDLILDTPVPDIGIIFKDRHALIVVRGINYKEDLEAIKSYIYEMDPIIIAVDGGADACLEQGYIPDLIVGDMDSVTVKALNCGAKLIVHAYPNGRAPGLKRINDLGLESEVFPAPGTSEDIAMLLAYEKGAELIAAVGTHTNMIDFLEKGRSGMASTLLVRLKVGSKLVDAKGVSKLYQSKVHYHYWLQILLSILLPLGIISFFSPPLKNFFRLIVLKLSLVFRF